MKKLIIFDLDGTLIDTLDDLKNSVNFALSKYGYPLRTKEDIRKAIGNGVSKLVERSIPDGLNNPNYKEALEIFTENYSKFYKVETKPYNGVIDTIQNLKNDGFLVSVCTNKIQNVAEQLIHDYFGNLFDYIQGDQPGINKKPHPDMVNATLSHFRLNSKDAIYIGDTEVDEQTAVNSSLDYLIVSYGFRTIDELKNKTPKAIVVNSQKELYETIKKQALK